jgi:hypothetical protein
MPFTTIHPSTRILESSPLSTRSNLRHRCNTTIVTTPSIKSDKEDVGPYPTRGPNLGKTCVSLCRLIVVEFAGSHKRSMIRKPSSMGIAGVEPRQGEMMMTSLLHSHLHLLLIIQLLLLKTSPMMRPGLDQLLKLVLSY